MRMCPNPRALLSNPVVAVAIGAGVVAVGGASAAYRGATRIPFVGAQLGRGVEALSRRGEDVLAQNLEPLRSLITAVAVQIVELVLAELDLTALVRERVDIDAVVRDVDIDAIIARIDLVGLADSVIDGVDLPRIIRESTTSVTADVMTDVRTQGERADDMVSGLVDRMLGRTVRGRTVTSADERTAGIISRGVAGMIDVLVVLAGLAALYVGWLFVRLAFSPRAFTFPSPSVVFSTLGISGRGDLYLAVCWAISGCTAGAVVMGVQVVDRASRRLRPVTALLRALACVVFPIGLAWVVVDQHRRSVQDVLLGTRVVYRGE